VDEFFERLKQRKIVQWALAYIAAAFALIQVLDIVAQRFGWPESLERLLILALAVGFFVTLVLVWYHGERGAQRVTGTELMILALLFAIGGVVLCHFADAPAVLPAATPAIALPTASTAAIPDRSVAVLPLANDSGEKDQQYFSDGLSDDLINALMQFGNLKVIGRASAFQFRDSKESTAAIGLKLGVAYLVAGSVRKLGDTVRINAQLVKAADGSGVWSQSYDRPYTDLFKLQDEITHAVADALKAKLLGNGNATIQSDRPPSGNLDAYNAFQQGRFYAARNNQPDLRTAGEHFREAIRIDPDYAAAYVNLSSTQSTLAANYLSAADAALMYVQAQAAIDTALRLNPASPQAHLVRAKLMANRDFDWRGAQAEQRSALELAPNDPLILSANARGLATLGQVGAAVGMAQQALKLDPLRAGAYQLLAFLMAANGRLDEARAAIDKAVELQPSSDTYRVLQADVETWRGHFPAALAIAQSLSPGLWSDVATATVLQIGPDGAAADAALKNLIEKYADTSAYQVAEIYALRRDPENMFKWLDRAWEFRDPGIIFLLNDAYLLRYRDDPRYAAFAQRVGLPATTDAKGLP
jgi:serine/threonine-protein kinase